MVMGTVVVPVQLSGMIVVLAEFDVNDMNVT